ncbi:MAG: AgmX/PglI C-terminal domain-containing protein [Gammaproteobacteria bacterium]|nr:AgmX/PglI C-terminal domain-containing protein [Gammaproteobacteria bacterium]
MTTLASSKQQDLDSQIQQATREHEQLKQKLLTVETELEDKLGQLSDYQQLIEISNQLEQLHSSGAGQLFWEGLFSSEQELISHIAVLRKKASDYDAAIEAIRQKKLDVEHKIKDVIHKMAFLEEDLQLLQELEADKENDFNVTRDIDRLPHRETIMPWSGTKEDQRRIRSFLLLAIIFSISSALLIPLWTQPIPDKDEVVKIPERLTKFIEKKKEKEKPKPEAKTQKKAASSDTKPTEKETKKAREKAANSGLLAFKNNFADLMDDASESKLGASAKLSNSGSKAKSTARSLISNQAKSGSAGINTASLSREVNDAGKNIGAVAFSRVTSEIGVGDADDRPLTDGPGPSRTDEEIQIVFDRYKAVLYRIYNRELRKNPTLQGKMVLRITIMPDGSVSACKVESTDLDSAVLSSKITQRVKGFNFGAKDGVAKITILYPIDFLPAS